jgi:flagellar protein FlaG
MDISSIKQSLSPTAGAPSVVREQQVQVVSQPREVAERQANEEDTAKGVTAAESRPQASREDVEAAVATIQDFVQSVRRNLNFSLEEGSGRVVVKVTDAGSGDVIRQIPSEEALQLAENLSEVRSLLFKAEA